MNVISPSDFLFLKDRSKLTVLINSAKDNMPSISGISKAGLLFYSEGYNLTIL
jgi:hypothetical protein